jgi:hypothetical protein
MGLSAQSDLCRRESVEEIGDGAGDQQVGGHVSVGGRGVQTFVHRRRQAHGGGDASL